MNYNSLVRHAGFTPDLAASADVVIRIQLSKTDYDKAVDRFDTMKDWIDREGSDLHGLVSLLYPQGSMAVGSTVARVSDVDEYDIDVIAELAIRQDSQSPIGAGYALQSDPWRARVALLGEGRPPRALRLRLLRRRHAHRSDAGRALGGAAESYQRDLPQQARRPRRARPAPVGEPLGFGRLVQFVYPYRGRFRKVLRGARRRLLAQQFDARAPAEDVPDRKRADEKSRALIALQLIKRWRNVLFVRRERAKLRRPPSVLLTKLIGDNANQTRTLTEELEHQAGCMLSRFEYEVSRNRKIVEVNPRCPQDVLTDRWPESMDDQKLMIDDLKDFIVKIRRLRSGKLDLAQMTAILEGLFGQRPVRNAVDDYIASMAPSRAGRVVTPSGRVLAPAAGIATPSSANAIRPHKFFGDP